MTLQKCVSVGTHSPALIIPSKSNPLILSHHQLSEQVSSFQQKLAAIGISPRDAVALCFPNTIEFCIAFLAVSLQRATCAPLNPAYKQSEFQFYLEDLKATLLLVPKGAVSENAEAIRAAKDCHCAIAEITWDGSEVELDMKHHALLDKKKQVDLEKPEEEDIALILHTSGTTSIPKTVPLTHRNLARTMANIQATYNLTEEDRTLLVMPLFHVHGLLAGFLTPLMSGGSVISPPRFSASDFWNDFVLHKANWYTAVPTIHQILLKNPLPSPMPPIRFIRSCSSPLSPTVHQQLEKLMETPVLEAYAMTEAAHQMTSNPLPPASRKVGSVGTPQGLQLRIMDERGQELSQGMIGEVCVLGPNVTSGYLGDPKMISSPFTADGYLRTGDQGYVDEDGYLFLTGRIKELINKGGEKISPVEIDNLLTQNPNVLQAVSFAIDDEIYGQEVAVAVVLQEGSVLSVEDLSAWLRERVANFKLPKKVYFVTKMPTTATGKVQRIQVARAMKDIDKQTISKSEPSPGMSAQIDQNWGKWIRLDIWLTYFKQIKTKVFSRE